MTPFIPEPPATTTRKRRPQANHPVDCPCNLCEALRTATTPATESDLNALGPMENLLTGLDESTHALSSEELAAELAGRGIKIEDDFANPDLNALRVRVAKLCGYTQDGKGFWFAPGKAHDWRISLIGDIVPDFPRDLNACAEFEKTLTREQGVRYRLKLAFNSDGPRKSFLTVEAALCHATAEQRCRAFVAIMKGKAK